MRKLLWTALLIGGATAFIGADVFVNTVSSIRTSAREALTADVPLRNQLAEARQQVDAYAESIIRGEVAADALSDRIVGVEREVRSLTVRVAHERQALVAMRGDFGGGQANGIVPASVRLAPEGQGQRQALRTVRSYKTANTLLERRASDLERLTSEHGSTLAALAEARDARARLSEEVTVLAAELDSLDARKAAARTRSAVGDDGISQSGFAAANERIAEIRASLREQNKLLQYYEVGRDLSSQRHVADASYDVPANPAQAIDEVLAAYPGR